MKKNYIAPSVKITIVAMQQMMTQSDGFSTNMDGLGGYGGVDTDGSMNASSRQHSLWDDDDF